MVDVVGTLAPESGLARRCYVMAPDSSGSPGGPLWTVAVDVGLEEARARMNGGRPGLDLVGACGFRRAETMVRAAGEAVERRALVPIDPDPARIVQVPAGHPDRVKVGTADVARAARLVDESVADCLLAADLTGGLGAVRTVLVPAAVVDDPCRDVAETLVEPSPSGAAAGSSWSFAVERALLESIERDTVLTAWALRPSVTYIDPATPPPQWLAAPAGEELARIAEALQDDSDLVARTLFLPTGVPGVSCALTLLFDVHGPTAAGSAAGWSTASAVATSAREALQVMVVLRNVGAPSRHPATDEIVDEMCRAEYWAHPASATKAGTWLERCTSGQPPDSLGMTPVGDADRLDHVARCLHREGLTPLICDLTARLPKPVQDLGWVAVRAIVLGHQALPMDERNSWIWSRPRLHKAAERWGLPAALADGCPEREAGPHPLI